MILRRTIIGTVALACMLGGCTSEPKTTGPMPDGAALLREASEATKTISSAHFKLKVNGQIPGVSVQSADADLTKEGSAKGKVKVDFGGSLIEGDFVLVNKQLYFKGPTGNYQNFGSLLTSIYDPAVILDPERGMSKVLASVSDPKTEGEETVNGVASYKVAGKIKQDVVSAVVPGIKSDVDIKFWIAKDGKKLPVHAFIQLPADKPGAGSASVELDLSDVDKPVTVTPPA